MANDHRRSEQLIEELNAKLMDKEQEVLTLSSALNDEVLFEKFCLCLLVLKLAVISWI